MKRLDHQRIVYILGHIENAQEFYGDSVGKEELEKAARICNEIIGENQKHEGRQTRAAIPADCD